MIIQTTRKKGKCLAAAHAASVDDIADGESHDPDIEPEDDTTEPNHQGFNEHEEISHDSNPCVDEVPHNDPEDELEAWVYYMVCATHKADDLLAVKGITSWILRKSRIYWVKTLGPLDLNENSTTFFWRSGIGHAGQIFSNETPVVQKSLGSNQRNVRSRSRSPRGR